MLINSPIHAMAWIGEYHYCEFNSHKFENREIEGKNNPPKNQNKKINLKLSQFKTKAMLAALALLKVEMHQPHVLHRNTVTTLHYSI